MFKRTSKKEWTENEVQIPKLFIPQCGFESKV